METLSPMNFYDLLQLWLPAMRGGLGLLLACLLTTIWLVWALIPTGAKAQQAKADVSQARRGSN